MRNQIFLFLIFSCLGSSCKKEPSDCKTVISAPKEFLNYWHFPVGSWWVYQLKDSSPRVYDTIRVTSQTSEYGAMTGQRACLMRYNSVYYHSNKIYFPYDSRNLEPGFEVFFSQQEETTNEWYLQWGFNSGRSSIGTFFKYPFQLNEQVSVGRSIIDTLQVITPNFNFFNSVHISVSDLPDTAKKSHIFITKNVGISKLIYSNDETWELINYSIK